MKATEDKSLRNKAMTNPLFLLAQTADVSSFFEGFDGDQRFVLTIIGIGCVTFVSVVLVSVLSTYWHKIKSDQIEADLKRDMLDRGMTADEIQKVIEATPQSGFDRFVGSWCKKR
jgi:hypothetical protein